MKPNLTLSDLPMSFIEWVECDYGIAAEGSLSKATLLHMGAAYLHGIDELTLIRNQLQLAVGALKAMAEDGFKIEYTRGKCKHGQYDFESCNQCYEEYAAQALSTINEMGK